MPPLSITNIPSNDSAQVEVIRQPDARTPLAPVPRGEGVPAEKPAEPKPALAENEPTPQPPAVTIEPEPLEIKPGEPLSGMALTAHPAAIPGVQAWTFETLRHRGSVLTIAYSADGTQFATGGEDGTVRLCDPASGKTLRILHGHTAPVRAVAWAPDSRGLASADGDGQICLWRIQDGRRLRVLRGHEGDVWSIAWSPDSPLLVSGGKDKTLRLWDVALGRQRLSGSGAGEVTAVAWSADGRSVAASDGKQVHLRSADLKRIVHTVEHDKPVTCVAFAPDSRVLASADQTGAIRLWEAASGTRLHPECVLGHGKGRDNRQDVFGLAFLPDGSQLLSAGADGLVRTWDVASGFAASEFKGHTNWVCAVACSPDGKSLLSAAGGDDGALRCWDVTRDESRFVTDAHCPALRFSFLTWSPDGTTIAAAADGGIGFVDAALSQPVRFVPKRPGSQLRWSPDGKFLAAAGYDAIHLMDPKSAETVQQITPPPDVARPNGAFSLSGDGRTIAVLYWRAFTSVVFDVATGNVLHTLKHDRIEGTLTSSHIGLSPDGKKLVVHFSGANGSRTETWDLETKQILWTGKVATHWLEWSPDGKWLARGWQWGVHLLDSDGKWLGNWGLGPGTEAEGMEGHTWFYAQGIFVGSSSSRRIFVWDVSSPEEPPKDREPLVRRESLPLRLGHRGFADCLSPSPSSPLVAIGAGDAALRIWEPRTDRIRAAVTCFAGEPRTALAFTGDGHYRVIGDLGDEIVYVVQTDQGEQLTLSAAEFATRYGWRNDPSKVTLLPAAGDSPANPVAAPETPSSRAAK